MPVPALEISSFRRDLVPAAMAPARQQKQQVKQQVQQQRYDLTAQYSEDWHARFVASLRRTGVMETVGEFVAERCARVRDHFAHRKSRR